MGFLDLIGHYLAGPGDIGTRRALQNKIDLEKWNAAQDATKRARELEMVKNYMATVPNSAVPASSRMLKAARDVGVFLRPLPTISHDTQYALPSIPAEQSQTEAQKHRYKLEELSAALAGKAKEPSYSEQVLPLVKQRVGYVSDLQNMGIPAEDIYSKPITSLVEIPFQEEEKKLALQRKAALDALNKQFAPSIGQSFATALQGYAPLDTPTPQSPEYQKQLAEIDRQFQESLSALQRKKQELAREILAARLVNAQVNALQHYTPDKEASARFRNALAVINSLGGE